jgi:hypothetical protein
MFVVGVLTVLAMTSDVVHDLALELIIPSAWSLFLVGNAVLAARNYLYLIYIYIGVAVMLLVYFGLIRPVKLFIVSHEEALVAPNVLERATLHWRETRPTRPSVLYGQKRATPKQTPGSKMKGAVMGVVIWCRLQCLRCYICMCRCDRKDGKSKLLDLEVEWQNINCYECLYSKEYLDCGGSIDGSDLDSAGDHEASVIDGEETKEKGVSIYSIPRRGFIPPEIYNLTKAHSEDVAFKLGGCVRLRRVLSQNPYVSRLHLPPQCRGIYNLDDACEMLMWKFEEELHGSFGEHDQPSHVPSRILVLPAKSVCECASYVLSSFHIYNQLLTDEEFRYFSERLAGALEVCRGFLDESSLVDWMKACTREVTGRRGPPPPSDAASFPTEDIIIGGGSSKMGLVVDTTDGKGSYTSFEMTKEV